MNKATVIKILIIIILVIELFLLKQYFYKHDVTKEVSERLSFEIIYPDDKCQNKNDEILKTDKYIYYLACYTKENVKIKLSDNQEFTLMEVINKNMISLDELIEHGLKVETYIIDKENNNMEDEPNPEVILSYSEIQKYNEVIKSKADMVYDLNKINSLSSNEILNYINEYKLPTLPKYNGREELNKNNTQDVLDNRNINDIKDLNDIPRGIVIKRTNLRSFPTNISFYDNKNIKDFDRLQETELLVNTPVKMIHESKDKKWYFVISPFYAGWVLKEDIALTTLNDYEFFINPSKFIVITKPTVKIDNTILDMSVKLPLDNNNIILPIKDSNGYVSKKIITINSNDMSIGYLPYTKNNVYNLATSYLDTPYSWGGKDNGVDCSSFVGNIYRTFGFTFPRNTSSQNKSVGKVIDLTGKDEKQKLAIIEGTNPSLLYQDGHVMLYVGKKDNDFYIIHASGSGKVMTSKLNGSSYIKKINRLLLVGE